MRRIRFVAASAFLAAFFAVSAFAQTATGKIGLIDTEAFGDQKAGIQRYVAAVNSLNEEFKVAANELQSMLTKLKALETEIQALQQSKVPVKPETANAKVEEYDKLTREYKFKDEDVKKRYESRANTVLGPIRRDIGNAIQEFTKKNGYTMVLDVGKLYNEQIVLSWDETVEITKAFVAFYNARPVNTAATTK